MRQKCKAAHPRAELPPFRSVETLKTNSSALLGLDIDYQTSLLALCREHEQLLRFVLRDTIRAAKDGEMWAIHDLTVAGLWPLPEGW